MLIGNYVLWQEDDPFLDFKSFNENPLLLWNV